MLRLLKLAVLLLSATMFATVFADDVNSQTQSFMQELEAKASNLTAEQKTQLDAILKNSMTQREAVLAKYEGQKGMQVKREIRDQLEPINASTNAEVQKVLTPEQYQAFQDVQKERQEKLRERISSQY